MLLAKLLLDLLQPCGFGTQLQRLIDTPGVLLGATQGTGLAWFQFMALLLQIGNSLGQTLNLEQILVFALQGFNPFALLLQLLTEIAVLLRQGSLCLH